MLPSKHLNFFKIQRREHKIAHCDWMEWKIQRKDKFTWPARSYHVLRLIYAVRRCRRRQAYDRPTTWIFSCKSNLQLAYDCRVGPKSCRRPLVSLLYATKSYRVNRLWDTLQFDSFRMQSIRTTGSQDPWNNYTNDTWTFLVRFVWRTSRFNSIYCLCSPAN